MNQCSLDRLARATPSPSFSLFVLVGAGVRSIYPIREIQKCISETSRTSRHFREGPLSEPFTAGSSSTRSHEGLPMFGHGKCFDKFVSTAA